MAYITSSVEYAIHSLLWLVDPESGQPSSRDLAELQGISPSFLAKIFPKLEKAGLVCSAEGVRGGYRLARSSEKISVLDIVDAIEGKKPLFDCQEIRERCVLFDGAPPKWATKGVCSIHGTMLRAEKAMRNSLAEETLASLAATVERKAPSSYAENAEKWFKYRSENRSSKIIARSRHGPDK
jgi:Rrf2 family protein